MSSTAAATATHRLDVDGAIDIVIAAYPPLNALSRSMRQLEVVRGDKIYKTAIATAMQIGKKTGKVAALSGVCPGFCDYDAARNAKPSEVTRQIITESVAKQGRQPRSISETETLEHMAAEGKRVTA